MGEFLTTAPHYATAGIKSILNNSPEMALQKD